MQDVCLFAHFDKDDRLDDYVLRYLAKLNELNFAIVLISASRLAPAEIAKTQGLCDDVMVRGNGGGLDFASWSAGFAKHGDAIGGRLLLANDSVYGPLGDLVSRPADPFASRFLWHGRNGRIASHVKAGLFCCSRKWSAVPRSDRSWHSPLR